MSKKIFQTFQAEMCRPGVRDAAEEILERIKAGYSTTTIVLPPRYGKSNLMRSVAVEAMETGLVGAVVCLVPWVFLMEQLNDKNAVTKMQMQHGMDNAAKPPRTLSFDSLSGAIDARFYTAKPQRHWWTMTMAQAYQESTRVILQSAATRFKEDERRPLLVFIDECHLTSSGDQGWGSLAQDLQDAGAHLVLLTGTPERSDDITPFGFKTREVSREESERWVRNDDITIEKRMGEKVCYEIVPDSGVSLKQAWSENIIAKIQTRTYTFDANSRDISTESAKASKRAMPSAQRDTDVVTLAANCLLEELRNYRNTPDGKETAAIVFVGSDRETDEKDFECRQVKRIIEQNWGSYFSGKADVKIATMGEDDGVKARSTIKKFVGNDTTVGIGDIIIVKQMGGVGLDAPRLKVGLDLSTIRTKTSATQRWLRVATKWHDSINHGTLILPDDKITKELFDSIVTEKGGQYCHENESVVETKSINQDGEERNSEKSPVIENARRNGSVDISTNRVDATTDLDIDAVFAHTPILAVRMTRREVADLISSGVISVPGQQNVNGRPSKSAVFDAEKEVANRVDTINVLTKDLANKTTSYSVDKEKWISARKRYMIRAKAHAGMAGDLRQCRDIDCLNKAIEYLEQQIRSNEQV